jgi:hypothetical protein
MQNMNARAWREKARPEVDPSLVIDLPLPSGFVCRATRPSLETWIIGGAAPLAFMDKVIERTRATGKSQAQVESEIESEMQADPDKVERANKFMVEAVTRAVVYPRIVDKADPKDEGQIELKDLPDRDFAFLFRWVLEGSPGVPVETKGGLVGVNDLANFRPESNLRTVGADVSKRRGASKRKARHKR